MITEKVAKELMDKFIDLRNKVANGDKQYYNEFKKHENYCISQFKYIIDMHANKYKKFCNYEDLVQEGFEAMLKAMKTYNPKKGAIFYWFNRYIATRISRSANTHTAIRYPLAYTKQFQPRKENTLPAMLDYTNNPEASFEQAEVSKALSNASNELDALHKRIVELFFGFENGKPHSINKVCKSLKISKVECIEALDRAINTLKNNIRI